MRTYTTSRARSLAGGALSVIAVVCAQLALGSAPAQAATTFTVTTTSDILANAGACGNSTILVPPNPASLSVREAVCLANNNGGQATVNIPAGTYQLVHGELLVGLHPAQNVTLSGDGAASTTIDAGGNSRVLDFDRDLVGDVSGTVSGLKITGGADSTFGGAGIIAGSGNGSPADTLTVTNSVVTDNNGNAGAPNTTNSPGGGLQFIGGALTVTNSTFSNNDSRSSAGAGLAYIAEGVGGESLSISGTRFSGNTMTNTNGTSVVNGGALYVSGPPSTSMQVTDSQFVNNTVTATTGAASGAAIREENGALTVSRSTFTGNAVSGGSSAAIGGAVEVTTGTATLHFNRFSGNAATFGQAIHVGTSAGAVNATDNWFGCNGGPGATGCDTVLATAPATASVAPRLVLNATASPSTLTGPNATSTVTASLTSDSDGNPISPANLTAFAGLAVSWSDPQPASATLTASSTIIAAGVATVGYNSHSAVGDGHVLAGLDNAVATAPITVNPPPGVPSAPTVTGTTPSPGAVSVAFTAGANGGSPITGFTAQCTSANSGVTASKTGASSPLSVTGVTPGKSYHCRVYATNAFGNSAWSGFGTTVVVPNSAAPGAPTVTNTTASPTAITATFTTPASNGGSPITGYTAQCTSSNGGVTASNTGASSPLDVTGMTNGKSYHCRVNATNAIGTGPWSAFGDYVVVPNVSAPAAPTVTNTTPSTGQLAVAFTAGANGGSPVTSFTAQCTSSNGGVTATKTGASSPLNVTGVTNGKSYHCRVNATNTIGTGAWSGFGDYVVVPNTSAPAAPTVTSTTPSTAQLAVAFTAGANGGSPITSFSTQCTSANNGVTATQSGAASPLHVTTVTPGKSYHCRVNATNAIGTSPWSAFGDYVVVPAARPQRLLTGWRP